MIEDRIDLLMREHPDLFPTRAKFWSFLRGCLRRGLWEKSPLKIRAKNNKMTPPPTEYTGRGRKGAYCALTGEWTPTSKMEVDHIDGHKPLLCEDDIIPYMIHLLAIEKELDVVDKEAHKIKSYAERMGITFEQAVIEKDIIAFAKKSVQEQIDVLTSLGRLPEKTTKVALKKAYSEFKRGEAKATL